MANLISYVHALDAEGRSQVFGPGDVVPGWAREQITNPKAWTTEPEPVATEPDSTLDTVDINRPIEDVLSWVGDNQERALEAFEAEQSKGEKARTRLMSKLEELLS